jgi:hypothetical protein
MSVIEYCRSLTLVTLNNLINVYGQDLKNKQWVLEPFANVVTSLSVMHNGFCRFNQLEDGLHKVRTLHVLKASIAGHYEKAMANVKEINCSISDKMNFKTPIEVSNFCNIADEAREKLDYFPDIISFKAAICSEFYKNEKYYLNV